MNLGLLRAVAIVDGANVAVLQVVSPRHGIAAASGYLPALAATALVHHAPHLRGLARLLCIAALVPNTALAVRAAGFTPRSRLLSVHVAVGGAAAGIGYLLGLRGREARRRT